MSITPLPASTIKLIGSSQVITSVSSVVKELMENSIDSGALNIEIRLDKNGFEKIEVKDDGCGVEKNNAMVMCLHSYTSKISDFNDLDKLSCYGFRGEALSSLCNVAKVSVTTKTADEDVATCYTFDNNGKVTGLKIASITKGTIVTITELFKNLPVRKQFMSNSKRASEELKKVEKIVKSLAMIHPRHRVILVHNKFMIWQKTSVSNLRQSVMQVISLNIVKQLHHILHNTGQVRVELLIPKKDCDISSVCYSNTLDALFLFINNRPVRHKEIEKAVSDKLYEYFGHYIPVNKQPVCVMSITLSPDCLDVNLEPNKTRVLIKNQEEVLDIIKQCMYLYYVDKKTDIEDKECGTTPTKRRKLETNDLNSENIPGEDTNIETPVQYKHVEASTNMKTISSHCSSETENIISSFIERLKSNSSEENTDKAIEQYNMMDQTMNIPVGNTINEIENIPVASKELVDNSENVGGSFHIADTYKQHMSHIETNSYCKQLNLPFNSNVNNDSIYISSNNNIEININSKNKTEATDFLNIGRTLQASHSKEISEEFLNPVISNAFSLHNADDTTNILVPEKDSSAPSFCMLKELNQKETNCINNVGSVGEESKSDERMLKIASNDDKDLHTPTLSQWSRGEVTTSAGDLIKGPHVVNRNVELSSPQPSQASSNRSVSSQMGCKEMSAFTKFARDMRKKILAEQPGINFTKVAQQLQVQWRHLDKNEKKKYEETGKVKKIEKQLQIATPNTTNVNKQSNIEIDIDLLRLKDVITRSRKLEERRAHLIGQLEASPLWLFSSEESEVTVVSTSRLLETVKFHQYLNKYALTSKLLDPKLPLLTSTLGQSSWNTLVSLGRSPNGIVTDTRIVSNGFHVEINQNQGELEGCISYVPEHIPDCGAAELQEILQHIQTHGSQATVSQCRPLRVVSFIRSQVMKECIGEGSSDPQQVSELLSYWLNHMASEVQHCIHGKPITQALPLPAS